jgi:hypothetical protein
LAGVLKQMQDAISSPQMVQSMDYLLHTNTVSMSCETSQLSPELIGSVNALHLNV